MYYYKFTTKMPIKHYLEAKLNHITIKFQFVHFLFPFHGLNVTSHFLNHNLQIIEIFEIRDS